MVWSTITRAKLSLQFPLNEQMIDEQMIETFDRRDIGWTSQNTVPRYSQAGLGWARCYWCWCWRFSIGYLVGVGQ